SRETTEQETADILDATVCYPGRRLIERTPPDFETGDKEIPLKYLANLLSDWAANEDGAPSMKSYIMGIITGMGPLRFNKKGELLHDRLFVLVDDGSLISKVYVHNEVVERQIGCSLEEIGAALSSPDEKARAAMRRKMEAFETMLSKFKGTLLVEMNRNSDVPVALEMKQGSSYYDPTWLDESEPRQVWISAR
ncbi:hypothetical protein MKW94_016179, partial [Papaver nudicaule]|nr:hypothetical protein [Papaver nudicaule]